MFLQACFAVLFFLLTVVFAQITSPSKTAPPTTHAPGAEQAFLKKEVEFMNKYRLMHAAAPLQLSLDLTKKAELWATRMAKQDKEKIDVNSNYGQNLFSSKVTEDLVARSVRSWYNEIRFYDFHSAKGSLKSSYFTQLVWVASQEVGIGKAVSGSGKTYIVALFNPPGNKGDYLHNVRPVTGSGVGKRGPSNCPDGYKLYNNVCYKYFPGPVNWVQASEKCAEQFSSLASIENQGEEFFIRTVLTSGGASDAWIGISDLNNAGIMSWLDGTPNHYMNWDYFQRTFPGKKCGVVSTNFNWKYKPCNKARGFVCKRPLRGLSIYMILIRYDDKLWTDNLYYPGSPRQQALSRHIQEAFLGVYGEYDWFESVSVDHFSKGEDDKILAYIKSSFTPDDDSPIDPIQLLRDAIQGKENGNSVKRNVVAGTLHGEKVHLINATLITADQIGNSCPAYCTASQCAPVGCSPWCCDPLGQQFFPNTAGGVFGPQQQRQPPQQPRYGSPGVSSLYNPANPIPAYPPQSQYPVRPQYPVSQQPLFPVPAQPATYQQPLSPQPQLQYRVPLPPQPYQFQQQHQFVARPVLQQQYPVSPRPQLYSLLFPSQLPQNRYQVPAQPQPIQNQVTPNPLQNSLQYLIMPPKPQPLHQSPQAYQSIPRPIYAPSLPIYAPPQQQPQMPIQAAPQFLQIGPNKKDQGNAKAPVQLQGMLFTYPYTSQVYQPAPVPPSYVPSQYYHPIPTVEHPKKQSNNKEKESEKEKEKEKASAEKPHEKPPVAGSVAPGYPFMGYVPQGYALQGFAPQPPLPLFPYPVPPPQTTWRIKLYRPVVTIPRPQPVPVPVFNQGYPVTQPYPIPPQQLQVHPSVPQAASPGLRPMEQRPQTPQAIRPPTGLPVNTYRPQQEPYQAYSAAQIPQRYPWQPMLKICPAPCPEYCAPACNAMCCNDRK